MAEYVNCPAGYGVANGSVSRGSCDGCLAGSWSPESENTCYTCPVGRYSIAYVWRHHHLPTTSPDHHPATSILQARGPNPNPTLLISPPHISHHRYSSECEDCTSGTYAVESGSSNCDECSTGLVGLLRRSRRLRRSHTTNAPYTLYLTDSTHTTHATNVACVPRAARALDEPAGLELMRLRGSGLLTA